LFHFEGWDDAHSEELDQIYQNYQLTQIGIISNTYESK
jgi:hypothetical protein